MPLAPQSGPLGRLRGTTRIRSRIVSVARELLGVEFLRPLLLASLATNIILATLYLLPPAGPPTGGSPDPSSAAGSSGSAVPTPGMAVGSPAPSIPSSAPSVTALPSPEPLPGRPSVRLVGESGSRYLVEVAWTPPAGGAAGGYILERRTEAGAWQPVKVERRTATRAREALPIGRDHRYRVRVEGGADGAWIEGPTFRLVRLEEADRTIDYAGPWETTDHPSYSKGSARFSARRGAEATLSFHGTGLVWIGPVGPTRGGARILVDGRDAGAVDTYARVFAPRRAVFVESWNEAADRKVTIRVQGTPGRPVVAIDAIVVLEVADDPAPSPSAPTSVTGYLLMPAAELRALPTSGPAWSALREVADGDLGRPDLCDQDSKHAVRALAAALVHARTDDQVYREKARAAVMSAIGTESAGCNNAILSLGRQLGAYVLAADLVRLSGEDDRRFRAWLGPIRTRDLGGHARWSTLTGTHEDSNNNWGAFAGASRIAASLYLGDRADVAAAARVVRGFLGDRSAYAAFRGQNGDALYPAESAWACAVDARRFVPVNGSCLRDGVDIDGAIVGDVWRDERGFVWPLPVGSDGIAYTLETLQGLSLGVELLARNGEPTAWSWSDSALRRVGDFITRNRRAGGQGWNYSAVSQHVPWLLNARLGTSYPTLPAGFGRVFGYTDWLFGR